MTKKNKAPAPVEGEVVQTQAPKELKISLARANKLRNSIESFMDNLQSNLTQEAFSTVHAFPNDDLPTIVQKIQDKKNTVSGMAQEYGVLASIQSSLKTQIAIANASSGISEVMAQISRLDRIITTFSNIYENRKYSAGLQIFDEESVKFQISKNKALSESEDRVAAVNHPTAFHVHIYSKADIDGETVGLRNLRKAKSDLEEKRNELNYSTILTLEGGVVEFLESRSLI